MILAAGLLVLLGLGLFVGGIVAGLVALYWGCVAACGLAAVLLVATRLRTAREARDSDRRASESASSAGTTGPATGTRPPEAPRSAPQRVADTAPAESTAAGPVGATAVRTPEVAPEPAGATALRTPEPEPEPAGATALRTPEPEPEPSPQEPPATVPPTTAVANGHADEHTLARRGAHEPRESSTDATTGEPGEEDVEVTDLLLVVDLDDEVLVVDEHPRYHLAGCPFLDGRDGIGLPMVEARTDGFTPCATCSPVRYLADTERSRRRAARGN